MEALLRCPPTGHPACPQVLPGTAPAAEAAPGLPRRDSRPAGASFSSVDLIKTYKHIK